MAATLCSRRIWSSCVMLTSWCRELPISSRDKTKAWMSSLATRRMLCLWIRTTFLLRDMQLCTPSRLGNPWKDSLRTGHIDSCNYLTKLTFNLCRLKLMTSCSATISIYVTHQDKLQFVVLHLSMSFRDIQIFRWYFGSIKNERSRHAILSAIFLSLAHVYFCQRHLHEQYITRTATQESQTCASS